jgi:hypothetical protein
MASKHDGKWFLSEEHERLSKVADAASKRYYAAKSEARYAAYRAADAMPPGPEADDVRHGPTTTPAKTAALEALKAAEDALKAYVAPRVCAYPAAHVVEEIHRIKLEKAKTVMRARWDTFRSMTDATKDAIRKEFAAGGITDVALARKYGVTQPHIVSILQPLSIKT